MKGTAMAVMVTVASASSCSFPVPAVAIQAGARLHSFSCDVSSSCCAGLEDAEKAIEVKGQGKGTGGMSKGRLMKDLVGTCGRADQVSLYNCAVDTIPRLVPAGKEGKARGLIQGKGCPHVEVSSGTDGSGLCHLWKCQESTGTHCFKKGTYQIEGVSTGCCAAFQASLQFPVGTDPKKFHAYRRQSQCGMIGACGKEDQKSFVSFANSQRKAWIQRKGNGKGGKPDVELQLPETFNFNLGGAQEMMTSFMTSEVDDGATEDGATEDGATEDGATEDGSQIMTGLLGFVAGAVVTGLGVTSLRRRTPTQDVYNEIVA